MGVVIGADGSDSIVAAVNSGNILPVQSVAQGAANGIPAQRDCIRCSAGIKIVRGR